MITKVLLYIKHKLPGIWHLVECLNSSILISLFYARFKQVSAKYKDLQKGEKFDFRILTINDAELLHSFFKEMDADYLKFFNPHQTDKRSLQRVLKQSQYLAFAFYENEAMVGYCFLRLFANKRAFIGRLVHGNHQGKGVAKEMAKLLYSVSKQIGFDVYSTISKENLGSLNSHKAVKKFEIVKELPNNYLLIKFDNA